MAYAAPEHIERARDLRLESTEVEKKLWYRLRNRQIQNAKFRRQHPIKGYYLDFACEEAKLAIELDGAQHGEDAQQTHDHVRTRILEESGWRVLRFWNNEITENIEGVVESIALALTRNQRG